MTGLDLLFETEKREYITTCGKANEKTQLEQKVLNLVGSSRKNDVQLRNVRTMGDLELWQRNVASYRRYSELPRI